MRKMILGLFLFIIFPASLYSGKKVIGSENVFSTRGSVCLIVFGTNTCGVVGSQWFDNWGGASSCGVPIGDPFVWLDGIFTNGCYLFSISNDGSFRVDDGSYGAAVQWNFEITIAGAYPLSFATYKYVGCKAIPDGCP